MDVQAWIPVTDAIKELDQFKSQPIVFVSHPIMIREASEIHAEDMIHVTSTSMNPNTVLSHINHKFATSRCRWLKKMIDKFDPVVPGGVKCKIDEQNLIVKV